MGVVASASTPRKSVAVPLYAVYAVVGALLGFVIGRATAPTKTFAPTPVAAAARVQSPETLLSPASRPTVPASYVEPSSTGEAVPRLMTMPTPEIKILSIDTRVTESNDTWSRYAWRLTLKNSTDRPRSVNAKIEFQDSGGFIVAADDAYSLVVPPLGEETFTDFALIRAEVRDRVTQVMAKIRE